MGRRRGRAPREFNPNKERDIGQEVIDKFDDTWKRLSDLIRDKALGYFAEMIKSDRDIIIGEAMLRSMIHSMRHSSLVVEKQCNEIKEEREHVQRILKEEKEALEKSLNIAREAADAAFPGVEDDDE